MIEQLNYEDMPNYVLGNSIVGDKAVPFSFTDCANSRGCYCAVGDTAQSTTCFLTYMEGVRSTLPGRAKLPI